MPFLAGQLAQLEDHGKRGLTAEAAFGLGGSEAHGRKGDFNGIGGAKVLPVLSWEVVEGEQHVETNITTENQNDSTQRHKDTKKIKNLVARYAR